MSQKLLILLPDAHMEAPFDQQLTIGRDVYNSLSLQDADISRSHTIIFEQDGKAIIKDLNSRNGVYVNGVRVTEQEVKDGDEITLGSTIIMFNPAPESDIEASLSDRGRQILKRREIALPGRRARPANIFTRQEMDLIVDKLFAQVQEDPTFFTSHNALGLLQTFYRMGHVTDTHELFEAALLRALIQLGGARGTIMECDDAKSKLKALAIATPDKKTRRIEIPPAILKVVVHAESCVFCPDVRKDPLFEKVCPDERPADSEEAAIRAFLAAPVPLAGEYMGFIYLDSPNPEPRFDYVAVRSLYLIAAHLGALLQPRKLHFDHRVTRFAG